MRKGQCNDKEEVFICDYSWHYVPTSETILRSLQSTQQQKAISEHPNDVGRENERLEP